MTWNATISLRAPNSVTVFPSQAAFFARSGLARSSRSIRSPSLTAQTAPIPSSARAPVENTMSVTAAPAATALPRAPRTSDNAAASARVSTA